MNRWFTYLSDNERCFPEDTMQYGTKRSTSLHFHYILVHLDQNLMIVILVLIILIILMVFQWHNMDNKMEPNAMYEYNCK